MRLNLPTPSDGGPTPARAHPPRHTARRGLLRRAAGLALAGACTLALLPVPPAQAAPGGLPNAAHGDSSPEWDRLRLRLFGERTLRTAAEGGRVRLHAPLRAAYGASVPVTITATQPNQAGLYVRRLTVVVDKNPSPVAATLDLSPRIGQADFETRLRVDEYSHVRVVAEWSDGTLHTDARYVKTSGGCSAPPNRESPELIGRTTLRLAAPWQPQGLNVADVTVLHPNDTGFELNQQTVMFIPPHFVRRLTVSQGDQTLFSTEQDFSVSENPTWRFRFVPQGDGPLRAEVEDSKERHYAGQLPLPAQP